MRRGERLEFASLPFFGWRRVEQFIDGGSVDNLPGGNPSVSGRDIGPPVFEVRHEVSTSRCLVNHPHGVLLVNLPAHGLRGNDRLVGCLGLFAHSFISFDAFIVRY